MGVGLDEFYTIKIPNGEWLDGYVNNNNIKTHDNGGVYKWPETLYSFTWCKILLKPNIQKPLLL